MVHAQNTCHSFSELLKWRNIIEYTTEEGRGRKMEDSLYLHLHKLSAINSEDCLDQLLTTLWKTRRTGLPSLDKSHFQSLLNLSSLGELDPVLACLRSVIRKSVRENFTGDDLLKLFPPDLAIDLQSMLILLLQKYQHQWREEISREQHPLPRTSVFQLKTSVPPSFNSLPSHEVSLPLWPRQDDLSGRFNRNDLGISTPVDVDNTASQIAPVSIQHDVAPLENSNSLPRLKSMTWTMENCNSAPANRVAIISLKLQDFTRSSSGEVEVKFRLSKDTLEAMLRSMTYISEQLSSMVETSSGPAQKKQKQ